MALEQEDGEGNRIGRRDPVDEIVIDVEDLHDEYPSPSRALSEEEVVITASDLAVLDNDVEFPPVRQGPAGAPVPLGHESYRFAPSQVKRASGVTTLAPIWQGLLFGAVGGFLAWAVQEAVFANEGTSSTTQSGVIAEVAIWAAIIGLILGAVLGSAEGITSRVSRKAWLGAAWGAGLGFVGGMIGGAIAQGVYGAAQESGVGSVGTQIAIRALGWGIFGLGVGLAQGGAQRKRRKAINGLVGGAVGGLVGGALFDPIGFAIGGGAMSRMVALTVLGVAMGLAVSLVEEARKEAWLQVVSGFLSGKQFILYGERTTIGSSPKCDIVLPKDQAVAPVQAVITRNRSGCILSPAAAGLKIDSVPVERPIRLRSGQRIEVGGSLLLYTERRESTASASGMGRAG